jgi:hypothetical protein
MAYKTFQDTGTDLGEPVLVVELSHWLAGPGALAVWTLEGQTGHRQPHVPTVTALTPPLLTPVPLMQVKAVGQIKTDGNYKTFHNRGGRELVSPPTK